MKNFLLIAFAILLAVGVYFAVLEYGETYVERKSAEQVLDADEVIVIEKDGEPSAEKNRDLRNIMEDMERRAQESQSARPSKEEKEAEFKRVWLDIKSRMVDPEPGTYPVKYYTPLDGVPIAQNTPHWIDEDYVIYPARFDNTYKDGVDINLYANRKAQHYELLIVNLKSKQVVKSLFKSEKPLGTCFDTFTRGILIPKADANGRIYTVSGTLDKDLNVINVHGPKSREDGKNFTINRPDCSRLKSVTPSPFGRNLRPSDGHATVKDREIGLIQNKRPNGEIREVQLDFKLNGPVEYDRIRDQYFIAGTFSMSDQRTKFFYFDRDFNLVEEYVLPRAHVQSTHPGTFLDGTMSHPLKDGVVTTCGRRGSEDGVIDYDGESVSHYLCHVRRDGKIVRMVKGYPLTYGVSPSGCRVFGSVIKHQNYDPDMQWYRIRNFSVNTCN